MVRHPEKHRKRGPDYVVLSEIVPALILDDVEFRELLSILTPGEIALAEAVLNCDGKYIRAARELGITVNTLGKQLARLQDKIRQLYGE